MSLGEKYQNLPKKYTQIFNFGKVINNKDPMNLGRVRLEVVPWQNQDVINSFKNPITGKPLEEKDYWTDVDPLVFMPLLPQFFSQVPKIGEFVHVVFYNTDLQDRNRYYIQGMFSSPNEMVGEPYDSSVAFTSKGERNKLPQDLRTIDGKIIKPEQSGLYPEIDVTGIIGRYNSDMLLPPNAAMLRVNKLNETVPNGVPTFNKKFSMIGLQKFDTRKVSSGTDTFLERGTVVQKIKYLIEYGISGGVGSLLGRFSGFVRIYKISDYKPIYSSSVQDGFFDFPEESKIGPIYQKDYTFDTRNDIIDGINSIISNFNSGNFTLNPSGSTVSDTFPFVFQPTKVLWDTYQLNVEASITEVTNATKFIESIYLNKQDTTRGVGYVSEQNRLGPLFNSNRYEVPKITYENNPITYGINVANTFFLLSHDSQIGVNKIDFDLINFSGNTIPQQFIEDFIIPNTSSMVRGEQLMDLLELIVRYLISHVHPYHGMAPDSQGLDGTQSQTILTRLFEADSKILNKYLRIN